MPAVVIVKIAKKFHFRVAEWLMAAVMLSWGISLAVQPGLFQTNPFFFELAKICDQDTWAVTMTILGVVRLLALTINGAWRASPHVRAITAFASSAVWLEVVFGLAHLHRQNMGTAVYPWFLLVDVYAVYRASTDARLSDERARGSVILG